MIQLRRDARGVILPVLAQAGARCNGIQGEHDGALRVGVTQAPEKGKANKAIVAVLAKQLGFSKSQAFVRQRLCNCLVRSARGVAG